MKPWMMIVPIAVIAAGGGVLLLQSETGEEACRTPAQNGGAPSELENGKTPSIPGAQKISAKAQAKVREVKEKRLFSSFGMDAETYSKWLQKEKSYNDAMLPAIILNRFDLNKDGQLSLEESLKMAAVLAGKKDASAGAEPESANGDAGSVQEQLDQQLQGLPPEAREKVQKQLSDMLASLPANAKVSMRVATPDDIASGKFTLPEGGLSDPGVQTSVSLKTVSVPDESVSPDDRRKALDDLYNRFDYDPESGFSGNKREEMLNYVIDHYPEVGPSLGDQAIEIKPGGLGL